MELVTAKKARSLNCADEFEPQLSEATKTHVHVAWVQRERETVRAGHRNEEEKDYHPMRSEVVARASAGDSVRFHPQV